MQVHARLIANAESSSHAAYWHFVRTLLGLDMHTITIVPWLDLLEGWIFRLTCGPSTNMRCIDFGISIARHHPPPSQTFVRSNLDMIDCLQTWTVHMVHILRLSSSPLPYKSAALQRRGQRQLNSPSGAPFADLLLQACFDAICHPDFSAI